MLKVNWILLLGLLVFKLQAQISFPVNGVRPPENRIVLIQNAMLHPDSSARSYLGEILIKNEWILEIGATVSHPEDAVRFDFQGKHVYPSFIDPVSDYGMGEVKRSPTRNNMVSSKEGLSPGMKPSAQKLKQHNCLFIKMKQQANLGKQVMGSSKPTLQMEFQEAALAS